MPDLSAAEPNGSHPRDEVMSRFVDGDLPREEEEAVQVHLASCRRCEELQATLVALGGAIADGPTGAPAGNLLAGTLPDDASQALEAALATYDAARAPSTTPEAAARRHLHRVLFGGAAAVACMVAALAYGLTTLHSSAPTARALSGQGGAVLGPSAAPVTRAVPAGGPSSVRSAYLELRPDLGPVACPGHLSAGSAASARRAVVRLARYGGASSCRLAGPTVSSLAAAGVTRFQATSTGAEITAHATLGTVSRRRLLAVVVTAGSRGHGTALGYAAVSCHLLIVSTFSTSDLETLARILGR